MGLDTSIYFQNKQVQLGNPLEYAQQAQNLKQMAMQNKAVEDKIAEEKSFKDMLQKNVTQGPDGNYSLNKGAALSDMYKANPQKALEFKKMLDSYDVETLKQNGEKTKYLAFNANPENWQQVRSKAQEFGIINADKLPEQYSDQFIKNWQLGTLAGEEYLKNRMQSEQFAYKKESDAKDFSLREKELESRALDRKDARDERRYQAGIVRQDREQALQTPYGQANSVDDAKQLKEAHEAKLNFDNKINQMIALREKHGGGAIMNREDVERGKQLSKDALLEYKNMAKLGVLSKSDEDIINAIIPEDPLSYNSPLAAMQGQDPTLNRLKKFKSDSDADFKNKILTRTRDGISRAADQNTKVVNGQLYRKVEGGWLPASK